LIDKYLGKFGEGWGEAGTQNNNSQKSIKNQQLGAFQIYHLISSPSERARVRQ
jgi:hypothetical protein